MKLLYKILLNTTISLIVIIAAWMGYTYYMTVHEIYDGIDDYLENYADNLIRKFDSGLAPAPGTVSMDISSNCHLEKISEEHSDLSGKFRFYDDEIYIDAIEDEQEVRGVRFSYLFPESGWYEVSVVSPSFDKGDLGEILLHSSILLGALLLIAIILIVGLIIYRSMKPLYSLLKWLSEYRIGEPVDIPAPKNEITEFRLIREAIISSARRSNETFEQQKLFIANASHEMQTPIAVCRNSIEMVAGSGELTEEQMKYLANTDKRLSYLSRLNKTLLLLSKIENNQFIQSEKIDLAKIFCDTAHDIAEINEHMKITLNIAGKDTLPVEMNPLLASSLATNLIKNAFFHNYENGEVTIDWDSCSISVWNTSKNDRLDENKIYDCFYKGSNPKEDSTGLGLAIVSAICRQYSYKINYSYKNERHGFIIQI